jgi:hypothetical protein
VVDGIGELGEKKENFIVEVKKIWSFPKILERSTPVKFKM